MGFWNGVVHAAEDDEGGAAFSQGADTMYRLQARPPAGRLLSLNPPCNLLYGGPGTFEIQLGKRSICDAGHWQLISELSLLPQRFCCHAAEGAHEHCRLEFCLASDLP